MDNYFTVMMKKSKIRFFYLILLTIVFLFITGCGKPLITGEPILYGINNYTGAIIDRDLFPQPYSREKPPAEEENETVSTVQGFPIGVIPHKDEIISIVVDSVFVKYLKESLKTSPQVLVWTEVYDDGSDDPQKAFTKVLFNGKNQPQGVHLGVGHRVIYGPAPFKGYPLRVRFFIVELDREQKETGAAIIETIGNVAAIAQPQQAPIISLAVQFAQSLSALNEDDYELRYDVTLMPVGPSGVYTSGDSELMKAPSEPAQREGKPFAISTPFRTGSYLLVKREIGQRLINNYFGRGAGLEPVASESRVGRDFTQEWITDRVAKYKKEGEVEYDYVLRAQGGYLWEIFRKDINDVVEFQWAENKGEPFKIIRGIRQLFRQQTHMLFTVVSGLPVKVDETVLAASSGRDRTRIDELLDAPPEETVHSRLREKVQDIEASLLTLVSKQRMSEYAAKRSMRDPSFRTNTDYVLFWLSRLDGTDYGQDRQKEKREAETLNASILDTVSNLTVNLPYMDAGEQDQMKKLKTLEKDDFEQPDKNSRGVFRLNEQGLNKLR